MLPWAAGGARLPFAYIVLNIDPILVQIGNLAVHWYGIAYVVAISLGLWFLLHWTRAQGIHDDQTWSIFLWTAIAGLIGGRLYFVIQQPDLVSNYLLQPFNIIKVWNGGMAFFGAIFLGTAMLLVIAPRYSLNRFLIIDGGALFAAIGQIFGRFGNIINGDITGQALSSGPITIPGDACAQAPCVISIADSHYLPWAFVYRNPHSFAALNTPFQPAPVYEMLANLIALAILWRLRFLLPRILPGLFFVLYLALYAVGQLIVFFFRGSEPTTPFLGINGLKQAQWTAIFALLACVLLLFLVRRFSRPWPYSAANPVPWPPATAGATRTQATRAVTTPRAALVAASRRAGGAAASSAAAQPAITLDDLPPWQPTHATHGRLRNVFTPGAGVP